MFLGTIRMYIVDNYRNSLDTYFNYGHNSNDIMWTFNKDKFITIPVRQEGLNQKHLDLWKKEHMDKYWRGRYDKKKNIISIIPPRDKQFFVKDETDIPTSLLRNFNQLAKKNFNIKIFTRLGI